MKASTASNKEKENDIFALDIGHIVRLHLIYLSFKISKDHLAASTFKDNKIRTHLENGCKIFALKQLILDSRSLYESGFFGRGTSRLLEASYQELLRTMRPQMVPFFEGFPKSSSNVPSTIGNFYGDIYEKQFETARNTRLNKAVVPSLYETHMKPVMTMRRPQVPKL